MIASNVVVNDLDLFEEVSTNALKVVHYSYRNRHKYFRFELIDEIKFASTHDSDEDVAKDEGANHDPAHNVEECEDVVADGGGVGEDVEPVIESEELEESDQGVVHRSETQHRTKSYSSDVHAR